MLGGYSTEVFVGFAVPRPFGLQLASWYRFGRTTVRTVTFAFRLETRRPFSRTGVLTVGAVLRSSQGWRGGLHGEEDVKGREEWRGLPV